jgi:hypothetical protein
VSEWPTVKEKRLHTTRLHDFGTNHRIHYFGIGRGVGATVKAQSMRQHTLQLFCCLLNKIKFNPLNAELNPTSHLLALGTHHILHVGRIRVNAVAVDKG